jgi:hypothetical protein
VIECHEGLRLLVADLLEDPGRLAAQDRLTVVPCIFPTASR